MMSQFQILPFDKYVLRTPAYSIKNYLELIESFSIEKLLLLYEEPFLREAIRIASPELLMLLNKTLEDSSFLSPEKKDAFIITLLKYYSRISSRCTPFGLFAGCCVGSFNNNPSSIELTTKEHFSRVTQFDMHFWVSLLQDLSKRKNIINELVYYPNNSIYSIDNYFRYIEYQYIKSKREHSITALKKSNYLEVIFEKAKNGITLNELLSFLIEDESDKEEALEFLYELIHSHFLISELNATLTDVREWNRIYSVLKKTPSLKDLIVLLQTIEVKLIDVDKILVPSATIYNEIKHLLAKAEFKYDEKYLFQTDLNISTPVNNLNKQLSNKVKGALTFLNGIQATNESYNIKNFINAFLKRYETKEVSLATVLDTEVGIGYIQTSSMNDTNPILDRFHFVNKKQDENSQYWSSKDFVLEKKLQTAYVEKKNIITLSEKDFSNFNSDWNNAPVTFSVMVEIIKNENLETIYIDSIGDVSAAKLLGRFCNVNIPIFDLTKEIIEKEESFYDDKIFAEIVHIPESRTGNILRRPILRKYEIPYLCNSGVEKEFQIEISDLMVSIKNNRIILKSKQLNKEVIPCLSNAHNFQINSLPIYQFLCDLQTQNLKPIFSFDWGVLEKHYNYFPRIIYKDVILSKAKWRIKKVDIENFYIKKGSELLESFTEWKNQKNMPRYVNWVNFDNTLLIDLEKEIGIQLFLKSVKNLDEVTLEEFLFTEDSIVTNSNGEPFTNQIIMSFYKEKITT